MKRMLLSLVLIGAGLVASCAPGMPTYPTVASGSVLTALPVTVSSGGGSGGGGTVSGGTPLPFSTTAPPTSIPSRSSGLSPTELKYRLLDQYPDFFYCDPDYYPVARADETDLARQRFPEMQANSEEFQAILFHNGMSGQTSFGDAQKLVVYRDYKKLAAIQFTLTVNQYQFQLRTTDQNKQGFSIQGLIDGGGNIMVQSKNPTFATCPICLALHTLIDTPHGGVFVEDLQVGEVVWTQNAVGERVAAAVEIVASVRVPVSHEMVHVILRDGRELWASPGHPTADGRRVADLKIGDRLDGAMIVSVERVPYREAATYDLLPAGGTGFYWANGILMGSTLKGP